MHPAISSTAVRPDSPIARFRCQRWGVHRGLSEEQRLQGSAAAYCPSTTWPWFEYRRRIQLEALSQDDPLFEASLAWHVRAWGRWALACARRELAAYYPTYAEFQAVTSYPDGDQRPSQLLALDDDGIPQLEPLNAEFSTTYLKDPSKPRWIAKFTVAYIWARTVACKQCRATLPLLKTRWLCKRDRKRVLLTNGATQGSQWRGL